MQNNKTDNVRIT